MTQYIDKSALVVEIKRRIKGLKDCHAERVAGYAGEISGLERLLSFIDSLPEEPASEDLDEDFCWAVYNYITEWKAGNFGEVSLQEALRIHPLDY